MAFGKWLPSTGRLLAVVAALCFCMAARSVVALEFGNKTRGWMELVSWHPRAYILHGLLTDAEADHIVGLALPHFKRSTVLNDNGTHRLDTMRTSSGHFLAKGVDEVVRGVEERVAAATHLPVSHAENLQVLKYELDQEYKAHYDVILVEKETHLLKDQANNPRMATMLMYLSDVEEGGETTFPHGKWIDAEAQQQPPYTECGTKGVAVKPRKGDALLFYSLKPSGQKKDVYSLHAGCPVVRGTKFSATSWIHVAPYKSWTAKPVQDANYGACRDNHEKCGLWATQGECEKNSFWMRGSGATKGNCRRSCNVCRVCAEGDVLCQRQNERPVAAPSSPSSRSLSSVDACKDSQPKCPQWAAAGECQANAAWMARNCPLSCNACPWTDQQAQVEETCADSYIKCAAWQAAGECERNPWMLSNCRLSCKVCLPCKDDYEKCSRWAAAGECSHNAVWMRKNCRLSCNACASKVCFEGNPACPAGSKERPLTPLVATSASVTA